MHLCEEEKIDLKKQTSSFFIHNQNQRAFKLSKNIYVEQQKIGSGSFSDVFLYKRESDGQLYALKILKDKTSTPAFLQECKIMKDVEKEIIQIDDQLCIMIEYANQGTLQNFLSNIQNQTQNINASSILNLVCDIFQGLNVLHIKNIIHRNLKMNNLLVSNFQLKIADLGVATYLISKTYVPTNIKKNFYELDEKYNSSADIFAAGLIILQMIASLSNQEILKLEINKNYTTNLNY